MTMFFIKHSGNNDHVRMMFASKKLSYYSCILVFLYVWGMQAIQKASFQVNLNLGKCYTTRKGARIDWNFAFTYCTLDDTNETHHFVQGTILVDCHCS